MGAGVRRAFAKLPRMPRGARPRAGAVRAARRAAASATFGPDIRRDGPPRRGSSGAGAGAGSRSRASLDRALRLGRFGGGGGIVAVFARSYSAEMLHSAGFIAFAHKDQLLHKCKMQQGRKQACCKTSEQRAGYHALDHVRSVAGKASCVAHIMCGIVQRLRLGVACQEQHRAAQHGNEQHRHQSGGFGRGKGLRGHHNLHPVTPDGSVFLCRAGLLARGS